MKKVKKVGNGKKRIIAKLAGLIVLTICAGLFAVVFFSNIFTVSEITVDGNDYYTREEILEMTAPGGFSDNTLVYYLTNHFKKSFDYSMIQSIEVNMKSFREIKIDVFERRVIGCLETTGSYAYFDKDGVVVNVSGEPMTYVPVIKGIEVNEMIVGKPLMVGDKKIFSKIRDISNSIDKHQLDISRIYLNVKGDATLYYQQNEIVLGGDEVPEDVIAQLKSVFAELELDKYIFSIDMHSVTGEFVAEKLARRKGSS